MAGVGHESLVEEPGVDEVAEMDGVGHESLVEEPGVDKAAEMPGVGHESLVEEPGIDKAFGGFWATECDPAESSYEEEYTSPEKEKNEPTSEMLDESQLDPDSGLAHWLASGEVNWIIFDGETEPVRLDQLSEEQEIWLENGGKACLNGMPWMKSLDHKIP